MKITSRWRQIGCLVVLVTVSGILSGSADALILPNVGLDKNAARANDHEECGRILPPNARPEGYSLSRMAQITAAFNVGGRFNGENPPDTPIEMLYTRDGHDASFDVGEHSILYVPNSAIDDSPPILGNFPNVTHRGDVIRYWYSQHALGNITNEIIVDGRISSLGSDYLAAVTVPPLPDGGGTHYIVSAAFVSPLKKGTHIVEIRAHATGELLVPYFPPPDYLLFSTKFTVEVH